MRKFTKAELLQYHVKNRSSAYVAYKGKVYDVSGSFLWQGGNHQALHQAGSDLTKAIRDAPHGPELLEHFPVVGVFDEE